MIDKKIGRDFFDIENFCDRKNIFWVSKIFRDVDRKNFDVENFSMTEFFFDHRNFLGDFPEKHDFPIPI